MNRLSNIHHRSRRSILFLFSYRAMLIFAWQYGKSVAFSDAVLEADAKPLKFDLKWMLLVA